ncbi:PLP-dependent aminotransferase family protein [Actinoallomurus bryophytorum]|uniref:GntR family transcriptional regulator/MocR family aminotransferase n=1 Tax=Actinoallomurus bryophytorum TaxID=1490222 RepID=A0A543BSR2_9ACTN|nr:PLP-dependent aminotransferase family protein [Actinoallomurus bryophytorum]TQL87850.1 GntR family transcriptional regulator/MocR family aminotransferase [Actinoallomurus bryophytorum]
MARTWAVSGVDLHLDLTGTRVRAALESALRQAVRTGRLAEGVRLPSSRALAADLGVARNTVADAYGQLVAEGWLTARSGSGTQVAARPADEEAAPPPARPGRTPVRYDLRPGSPALSLFPRTAWLAAARRALNAAPAETLGYGHARGLPELRTALAGYLARARGVRAAPERVVVCAGFTQALTLLVQVLRARGATTLGIEALGHRQHHDVIAAGGLRPRRMPVDDHGAVVDAPAADAMLLTPAHQFPLGMPLAAHRRTRAVQWAHDTGGLIIEDDYDGEFRYDRQPVGALQALAPEHVVYAGTASKTLAPGLRLAWLVLPAALVDEVAEAKRIADGHTSTFEQLTLAEFVTCGDYDRHVRRCRLAYRRRRDRLVTALRREAPRVRVTGVAAGMHALLELPPGTDEDEVVARAGRHGLALEGLRTYRAAEEGHRPALVVGYATPPDHSYTGALARLCAVLAG